MPQGASSAATVVGFPGCKDGSVTVSPTNLEILICRFGHSWQFEHSLIEV